LQIVKHNFMICKMWIPRLLEVELKRRANERPVLVVSGARQTGKTSLVRRVFSDHSYVSLDLPSAAELAERDPELFLRDFPAPLLVDEVQYAPGLFRHLKRVVDEDRDAMGRFVLTGSQPFTLMQGVAESLAGRVAVMKLGGLSMTELQDANIDLPVDELLLRGGFPELYSRPELGPRDFYHDYVASYLERDLRTQMQVGSLRDFERFLRAVALRTSQLLNKAELARDVGVSAPTVAAWLSVLERSELVALLEPWFSNRTKALVKTPKLHVLDSGLACFLMGAGSAEALRNSPLIGALWESRVFTEMRLLLDAGIGTGQLAYWRDRGKEADFLLHRAGHIQLADAKWTAQPEGAGSLERVRHEFDPPPNLTVFCRTPNRYPLSGHALAAPLEGVANWLKHERRANQSG